jgi:hypothetical protein
MSVTINASTSAGLVMTSDLSGTLSLQSNGVAVTVPAVAGTMMVSGNMPAFSAYPTSNQAITLNTWTKLTLGTEEFDTNNNFSSGRFTPTVAGYYQICAEVGCDTSTFLGVNLYKNGSAYKNLASLYPSPSFTASCSSALVYLNGSTDYIELYVLASANVNIYSGVANTYFSGVLVRTA